MSKGPSTSPPSLGKAVLYCYDGDEPAGDNQILCGIEATVTQIYRTEASSSLALRQETDAIKSASGVVGRIRKSCIEPLLVDLPSLPFDLTSLRPLATNGTGTSTPSGRHMR